LRLDQTEDLGAEIVAAVGPAQAATRYRAEPQVHALDARRIHEYLVLGTRQRKLVDQLGVELDRQQVAGAGRILPSHEVVGPQGGLHQRREGTQDAIGVQAHQRIDVCGNGGGGRLRVATRR